jgi:hypothetical protein
MGSAGAGRGGRREEQQRSEETKKEEPETKADAGNREARKEGDQEGVEVI